MKRWVRILSMLAPLIIGYSLTFIDLKYANIGAAVFIGGTMIAILVNVLLWQTKPKKLITP